MSAILVATDFSACSRSALQLATALARRRGASLCVVHVVEPPTLDLPAAPINATAWELELLAAAERELARLASELRQSEITVETRAIIGSPARLILDLAGEIGAELIVLGTHGRKGAAHLFLGSVAEQVVRAARYPVLVTRAGAVAHGRWDGRRRLHVAIAADGTRASDAAFAWVRLAGQDLTGEVSLLRVYWPAQEGAHYGIDDPWPGEAGHAELLRVIERDLRHDTRALSGAHDPPVRFRIASSDAAAGLCNDAHESSADALVVGISRHGRSSRPVSPLAILRSATLPVFCIPEANASLPQRLARVRSVLLACDMSDASKAALGPAYGLLSGGGRVELCYVHQLGRPDVLAGPGFSELTPNERAAIEAELRALIPPEAAEHAIATHVSVIEAPLVDQAILAAAERLDVDVLAIGSHGRSGVSRALLGSVAEQVARRSPRPVLIVRAQPTSS